jgi:hypothetical protein
MVAVIADVNSQLKAANYGVILELERWETDAIPGLHLRGPQGQIDDSLRIENSDIVVGVFGRRLGTPVDDARSGTEHEIRSAISSWNDKGSPAVMLYFNNQDHPPTSEAEQEQYRRVNQFRQELEKNALYWLYENVDDFATQVTRHLFKHGVDVATGSVQRKDRGLQFEAIVEPVVIRAEGDSELLGTVFIKCSYESAEPPPEHLSFSLELAFDTAVTSTSHILFEVGRPGASGVVHARGLWTHGIFGSSCEARFEHVSLDGIAPHETRTFQIVGLRCDPVISVVGKLETVRVQISATAGPVKNNTQVVAHIRRGVAFEVLGPRRDQCKPTDSRLSPIATLRFRECFPHAFKVAGPGQLIKRDDGRFVFAGESPPFGATANHGTRLTVQFLCVPPQLRLFVPNQSRRVLENHTAVGEARIVEAASTLRPGDGQLQSDGIELREVLADSRSVAEVVWEVKAGISRSPDLFTFDMTLYVAYEPGPLAAESALGQIWVGGGFGPVFATPGSVVRWRSADPSLPVPRFCNTSLKLDSRLLNLREWTA